MTTNDLGSLFVRAYVVYGKKPFALAFQSALADMFAMPMYGSVKVEHGVWFVYMTTEDLDDDMDWKKLSDEVLSVASHEITCKPGFPCFKFDRPIWIFRNEIPKFAIVREGEPCTKRIVAEPDLQKPDSKLPEITEKGFVVKSTGIIRLKIRVGKKDFFLYYRPRTREFNLPNLLYFLGGSKGMAEKLSLSPNQFYIKICDGQDEDLCENPDECKGIMYRWDEPDCTMKFSELPDYLRSLNRTRILDENKSVSSKINFWLNEEGQKMFHQLFDPVDDEYLVKICKMHTKRLLHDCELMKPSAKRVRVHDTSFSTIVDVSKDWIH